MLFLSTHELMFSGHTIFMSFLGSTCFLIRTQSLLVHYILVSTGAFLRFVLPLSLVAAKQHYTVDVIVAMIVYHACMLSFCR